MVFLKCVKQLSSGFETICFQNIFKILTKNIFHWNFIKIQYAFKTNSNMLKMIVKIENCILGCC